MQSNMGSRKTLNDKTLNLSYQLIFVTIPWNFAYENLETSARSRADPSGRGATIGRGEKRNKFKQAVIWLIPIVR